MDIVFGGYLFEPVVLVDFTVNGDGWALVQVMFKGWELLLQPFEHLLNGFRFDLHRGKAASGDLKISPEMNLNHF